MSRVSRVCPVSRVSRVCPGSPRCLFTGSAHHPPNSIPALTFTHPHTQVHVYPGTTRLDKSDSTVRFKTPALHRGGRAGTHTRTSQQSHNQADSYRYKSAVQKQRKLDTETGASRKETFLSVNVLTAECSRARVGPWAATTGKMNTMGGQHESLHGRTRVATRGTIPVRQLNLYRCAASHRATCACARPSARLLARERVVVHNAK